MHPLLARIYAARGVANEQQPDVIITVDNGTASVDGLAEANRRLIGNMGDDWWPYGYDAHKATLETFLRYHHEQGLSKRRLEARELFAPETLEPFKI